MRRRGFIALAAGAAMSPLVARAQPSRPVVGFLSTRSPDEAAAHTAGFLQGLKEAGFTEPGILTLAYRWARGNYAQLPALAAELIDAKPTVLAAGGDPAALALKAATASTPIAFLIGDDPVRVGLVASLNRPGGNATGVSLITSALGAKRLEIMTQMVPSSRVVGLLVNPTNPNADAHTLEVKAAASALKRELVVAQASTESQFEGSLSTLMQNGARALVVQNDPFFDTRRDRLIALVAHHALPAIFHIREFPTAGALVSYGPSLVAAYRELGLQTARLLQGARPEVLPVVRPNTFEFVINTKSARTLGLTVPESLIVAADEVIE
jgi:putative tryptophan/tyrosine transport system substrate-binding protein